MDPCYPPLQSLSLEFDISSSCFVSNTQCDGLIQNRDLVASRTGNTSNVVAETNMSSRDSRSNYSLDSSSSGLIASYPPEILINDDHSESCNNPNLSGTSCSVSPPIPSQFPREMPVATSNLVSSSTFSENCPLASTSELSTFELPIQRTTFANSVEVRFAYDAVRSLSRSAYEEGNPYLETESLIDYILHQLKYEGII